ncbi:MAG TPA: AAA family ATPase [Methanocorpusculum sp.]|nr:AAA family ATPase [Methanocorpusculum sp.]HJJ81509.1 AAA family ATPase [Methanocorpusculum sp.]
MSIMILGSSSHAGKSTIVAGICRILSNRGIASAPFKSQNMSLNSYVTELGKEIGIAQAVQAFAARTAPTELMNPILLKPKSNGVSQVVLLGEPLKDVKISDYYLETDWLLEKAVDAYKQLEESYDTVVIEGAGGAAEVNLYERDIANILLAKRKPVIGICGGYQMMGDVIFDDAFEGTVSREYGGLGLLSMRTEFLTDNKITIQKSRVSRSVGPILSRMGTVHVYEIHAGVSEVFGESAFEDEGAVADGGLVFGTYLHGLFDNASAVDALVSYLAEVRGISYEPVAEKGDPYDNLSRHLESCLDVDMLMEIIGL